MDKSFTSDKVSADVVRGGGAVDNSSIIGEFTMTCFNPDGSLKWEEKFDNVVTDEGKKFILDQGLAGVTSTVYRMFIFTGGTPNTVNSTYAGPLVTEVTSAIIGSATRNTITWNTAGSTTAGNAYKSTAAVVYTIGAAVSGATSITGAAIVVAANNASVATVSNTADLTNSNGGRLYSAGTFGATKSVTAGDVLNVTYTTSLSS